MKQEYRKQSAEWMGLKEEKILTGQYAGLSWVRYPNGDNIAGAWQPDIDHNQMAMMEDKLRDENIGIEMKSWGKDNPWHVMLWKEGYKYEIADATDKDKRIAFMKAFVEYIKQK